MDTCAHCGHPQEVGEYSEVKIPVPGGWMHHDPCWRKVYGDLKGRRT